MNSCIVIVGFMGCGKTTVAREVARRLDAAFIDLDSFIAERDGRTPAEIIGGEGEQRFREIETLCLRDVLQERHARVIALGGGTWTIPANRTLVALHECASVWLDVPFETCWERISTAQAIRPLAPDRETALGRYEARKPDYALTDHRIEVKGPETAETIAQQILRET